MKNTMKKVNTSLSIIMIVVSLFVVTVAQAQQNVDVNDEDAVSALANWYACHYGNIQPACDATVIANNLVRVD